MEKDNYVFISGASGFIGSAIALKLAEAGYDLLLHYHTNKAKTENLQSRIHALGQKAELVQFDLVNYDEIQLQLRSVLEDKAISHFIHAGGTIEYAPLGLMKIASIQRILRVNLESFFYLSKIIMRNMIRRRSGRIIAIGSIAGQKGFAGQACYSASKAGLEAAASSLAKELGPYSIQVNVIAPGLIDTPFSSGNADSALQNTPMGRPGRPEEVADLVVFLCSNKSSFISGAVIPITGGTSI